MLKPEDFIHPEDRTALQQLESVPGFPALAKKIMAMGIEQYYYGTNMASNIRLSEKQLPELYRHLPPICEKLGIPEPEFYLTMNPFPNAMTFGDSRIYITVTSGLVELMDDDELDAVLAHECGHILCRHTLYHTVATLLLVGADKLGGLIGTLTQPAQLALFYWSRRAELSCDRCACLATSPDVVCRVMARLSGGAKSITDKLDLNAWAQQADRYDEIRNDGMWNKALQTFAIYDKDHPFSAVRVREVLKWAQSEQYKHVLDDLQATTSGLVCPTCGNAINRKWKYCKHCGTKL